MAHGVSSSSPGGADSAATAAGLVEALGADRIIGLHLNYGLRPDSDGDQGTCEELCRALGIELQIERPRLGGGNVQAEARRARYAAAERCGSPEGSTGSRPATPGPTSRRP